MKQEFVAAHGEHDHLAGREVIARSHGAFSMLGQRSRLGIDVLQRPEQRLHGFCGGRRGMRVQRAISASQRVAETRQVGQRHAIARLHGSWRAACVVACGQRLLGWDQG